MTKYLDEVKEIERLYFKASFDDFSSFYILTVEDKGLEAYLIYSLVLEEAEIISIFVKEKFRRQGLATKLINELKQKAKVIYLEVNENNSKAYNLYRKLGFVVYHQRLKYYDNKDTALLMKWSC